MFFASNKRVKKLEESYLLQAQYMGLCADKMNRLEDLIAELQVEVDELKNSSQSKSE